MSQPPQPHCSTIRLDHEMLAYEALWSDPTASFTNLAQMFSANPGSLPSAFIDPAAMAIAKTRLVTLLGKDGLSKIGIMVHGAAGYPSKMRDALHPVELLYYSGNWSLVATPSVAIIGTREPSDQGLTNAARIASSLSAAGYTIVSGLAQGIDTEAHTAAMQAGGQTIAVIGTPLNEVYPRANHVLQAQIATKHLLISQVPFLRYSDQDFTKNKHFFPARNATMSALTQATIIIEAKDASGTLIQGRAALAQGRKLLILANCFKDEALKWPKELEAQGAVRVENLTDIKKVLASLW